MSYLCQSQIGSVGGQAPINSGGGGASCSHLIPLSRDLSNGDIQKDLKLISTNLYHPAGGSSKEEVDAKERTKASKVQVEALNNLGGTVNGIASILVDLKTIDSKILKSKRRIDISSNQSL